MSRLPPQGLSGVAQALLTPLLGKTTGVFHYRLGKQNSATDDTDHTE